MNWLAISQRVNVVSKNERYDAVDQRWNAIALELGFTPIHLPNIPFVYTSSLMDHLNPKAIILTGGNSLAAYEPNAADAAPERDAFEHALLNEAIARSIPVLGICRGMQVVNDYYGGTLQQLKGHAGTVHGIVFEGELQKLVNRNVNSYHHWGIDESSLGLGLVVLARAVDGTIEAVKHQTSKVTAIMWHPEREMCLTQSDIFILEEALR